MAKTKKPTPPALLVGTIFLLAALSALVVAMGALQGVQDLFTQASGNKNYTTRTIRTLKQTKSGCVPRPACLDENPACQIDLPAGVQFCQNTSAGGSNAEKLGSPIPATKPAMGGARKVPAPAPIRPIAQ